MARIPVKQVSYTLGCAHYDGHPIHILGSCYDSKREAKKALKKELERHPDAFVVKVTEERVRE